MQHILIPEILKMEKTKKRRENKKMFLQCTQLRLSHMCPFVQKFYLISHSNVAES